jgi:1-acyl-sn-glycerol-3-phosphate acyltransferase
VNEPAMTARSTTEADTATVLRSVLFIAGKWLFVLLFTLLLPLLFFLSLRGRYAILTRWSRITLWWLRITCRLDFEVSGREHIPSGPTVVLSNHQSAWETLAFQSIFPPQVWVLKRNLLWVPLFGWSLAMLRPIAIDRAGHSKALRQVVDQGRERLAEGMWVVAFPEGTRRPPGELGTFNPGGAMLAHRAGVPALPVALDAGRYWPRANFPIRPGTVHVAIGPPIETAGRKAKEINLEAERWIAAALPKLGTTATDEVLGNGER